MLCLNTIDGVNSRIWTWFLVGRLFGSGSKTLNLWSMNLSILVKDEKFSRMISTRSEEHTSELQSHSDLVCRLLLEKKKNMSVHHTHQDRVRREQLDHAVEINRYAIVWPDKQEHQSVHVCNGFHSVQCQIGV